MDRHIIIITLYLLTSLIFTSCDTSKDKTNNIQKEDVIQQKKIITEDSIIKLFRSIPSISFTTTLQPEVVLKNKGKFLKQGEYWKMFYDENETEEDSDNYEEVTITTKENYLLVQYLYAMDLREILFYYSETHQQLLAIYKISLVYTSTIPNDILKVYRINPSLHWEEVTEEIIDIPKTVDYFVPGGEPLLFNDLFSIQLNDSLMIFKPNVYFTQNLDTIIYHTHPFFKIDKSKLNDSIICYWLKEFNTLNTKKHPPHNDFR